MAATLARRCPSSIHRRYLPPQRNSNHQLPFLRHMTTSFAHVAARPIDHTFEKLMDVYKHYLKVVSIQDLILSSPDHSLPLPFLTSLSQKLHLNRGAPFFLRKYPHIFSIFYDPDQSHAAVRLTPAAAEIARLESEAIASDTATTIDRLVRVLSMSPSRMAPLRAVFKVWKELGLPDDFEDSILLKNPGIFSIQDNPKERNTHLLGLVAAGSKNCFTPAAEKWREMQRRSEDPKSEEEEIRHAFKQGFPPGMKLKKSFRKKVKEWQLLPYRGPYDENASDSGKGNKSRERKMAMEKRAVGIVHEFLSLTVEKMVEVEQISQFRKCFDINLNIRDLFVDHPGIFYLSTKGKRHTVFLREAYERGQLVEPNPVYEVRRKLFHLVMLRRRGLTSAEAADPEESLSETQEEGFSDF